MRLLPLALVALLPATGCSAFLANSGEKPEMLSRWNAGELASAEPVVTETKGDGSTVTFHTRRKIAAPAVAFENAQYGILTFGLSELALFPWEVYQVTRTALLGSEVKVFSARFETYSVYVNGRPVYLRPSTPPLGRYSLDEPPGEPANLPRKEAAATP